MSASWISDDQQLMLALLRATTHAEAVVVATAATDDLMSRPLIKPWAAQDFAGAAEGLERHNHPVAAWAFRMLAVQVGDRGELVRLGIEAIQFSRGWTKMVADEIARRIRIWNDIADGKRASYGVDLFAEVNRMLVADIARKMDREEEEIRSKPPADIWIADFVCAWSTRAATEVLVGVTRHVDKELVESFPIDDRSPGTLVFAGEISRQLHERDHRLSWAWQMLAAAKDAEILRAVRRGDEIVCGSELPFAPKAECIARLEVMKKLAEAKPEIDDAYAVELFALANMNWREQLPNVEGGIPRRTTEALLTLLNNRWTIAVRDMARATRQHLHPDLWSLISPDIYDLRPKTSRKRINAIVDLLIEDGTFAGGELAIGWLMVLADVKKPSSFYTFLPQLQRLMDTTPFEDGLRRMYQDRLNVWWRAAAAEFVAAGSTIFEIVEAEVKSPGSTAKAGFNAARKAAMQEFSELDVVIDTDPVLPHGPSLVVMPKDKSTKLDGGHSVHGTFKTLVDERLPLVVARDVAAVRRQLHLEYPHATLAVDLVLRDLRQDKPVTLKPLLLVGGPGAGKSRLVRRLGELLSLYVFRYDGAAALDNMFGGVSKSWNSTQPSAPARAVEQARHANPIVMIDELEKASSSSHNGNLWNAMMPFLEPETAKRFRDPSLDAELDLSRVTFCATANDDKPLPSPLKDRFRIIRVPEPTLAHLPALAANVMRDIAAADEVRRGDEPLADDELEVIGRAWRRSGMSMRKLQKIVGATLDARDQFSMRH